MQPSLRQICYINGSNTTSTVAIALCFSAVVNSPAEEFQMKQNPAFPCLAWCPAVFCSPLQIHSPSLSPEQRPLAHHISLNPYKHIWTGYHYFTHVEIGSKRSGKLLRSVCGGSWVQTRMWLDFKASVPNCKAALPLCSLGLCQSQRTERVLEEVRSNSHREEGLHQSCTSLGMLGYGW